MSIFTKNHSNHRSIYIYIDMMMPEGFLIYADVPFSSLPAQCWAHRVRLLLTMTFWYLLIRVSFSTCPVLAHSEATTTTREWSSPVQCAFHVIVIVSCLDFITALISPCNRRHHSQLDASPRSQILPNFTTGAS